MNKSTYFVEHMDCSAEEQMVRIRLDEVLGIEHLEFDLRARQLVVYHTEDAASITSALDSLRLGSCMVGESLDVDAWSPVLPVQEVSSTNEMRPLMWALAINATFFFGELVAGLFAGSMGLVADALDMLADALVYALSIAAVGGTIVRKKQLAGWSGYLQFGLAVLGVIEVLRRFLTEEGVPDVTTMIIVAAMALIGNVATLLILSRAQRGEAHVEASWIFTSNDVKVNALVIASATLVWLSNSNIPDLICGALIFIIVANGARRILTLSK
ncbi:MAG: cation transporter [Rhodothermales bacterium]|nr:cation transporter [Rhodothermales bacterium]